MKELMLRINSLFTKKKSKSFDRKELFDTTELWNEFKTYSIKWKYEIVKFVIINPDSILRDNNLWKEFKTYIKDLYLYDFDITDNTDRLMVVNTVKIQLNMILKGDYEY